MAILNPYSKTTYVDGTTPDVNAVNLNKNEQGVYDVTEKVRELAAYETNAAASAVSAANSAASAASAAASAAAAVYADLAEDVADLTTTLDETNVQLSEKANQVDLLSGVAELIDGRVEADGTVHTNIGEALRNIGKTEKTIGRKALADDIFVNKLSKIQRIVASSYYGATRYITVSCNVNMKASTVISKVKVTGKLINKSKVESCLLLITVGSTTLSENYTTVVDGFINFNSEISFANITAAAFTVKLRITGVNTASYISADVEDLSVEVNDGIGVVSSVDKFTFIEAAGTVTSESIIYNGVLSRKEVFRNELEATFTTGGFLTQYGTISADSSYAYSNLIKVRGGKTVKLSNIAMTPSIAIWLADERKKIIQYYQVETSGLGLTLSITLPDTCCYIGFTKYYNKTATIEYETESPLVLDVSDGMFYYPTRKTDKPIITFVDDDGRTEFYTRLKNIFDAYSVKATTGVITNNIGVNPSYMTLAQLNELKAAGYDICSHTASHSETIYNPGLNDAVTEEEIYNDLLTARKWIAAKGFNSEALVFPWGSYGTKKRKFILQAIKAGYQFAMDAAGNAMSSDIIDTYWLERYFVIESRGLAAYKTIINSCVANNGWLIIGTHSYNTNEMVTDAFFESIVSYAVSSGAEIMTFKDASAYKRNICSIGYYGDKSNRLYIGRTGKILNN